VTLHLRSTLAGAVVGLSLSLMRSLGSRRRALFGTGIVFGAIAIEPSEDILRAAATPLALDSGYRTSRLRALARC
jgi:hypothetical protein